MHTFLAAPTYDGWRCNGKALFDLARMSQEVDFHQGQSSVTALNCNKLWCEALNNRDSGITHFMMLHADIQPLDPKWFLRMHEEMAAVNADVLSVVVPMKTFKGETSTGIETSNPWRPRKLTYNEIRVFPETFTKPDLLVNTGLMLVDLRKPWVEEVTFTQLDTKSRDHRGLWVAESVSEDWSFARQARQLCATIFATRKIKVAHRGEHDFRAPEE